MIVGLFMPKRSEAIQGEADMTDYRISSKVPGRVAEIRVKEGDVVRKGDTLVVLTAPDIMAKLDQANAALEAARALEKKAVGGARQEQIQGAYEMWQKAKAGFDVAQKTYDRVAALYADSAVSAQKYDEAHAQLEAYKATERAAKSQYDMAVNGAQQEDIAAAKAQVERAMGAVSEVSSYLDEMVLTALADGEVTDVFPELGELVGTGSPLVNVSVTDDVWFTFNVREDMLPGLEVGMTRDAYIPARDRHLEIKITKMKNVGTYAVWKATKALDQIDLKVFEVRAKAVSDEDVKDVRAGMSVVIED